MYQAAGLGYPGGNAIDYWAKWKGSGSSDLSCIPVGAAVVGSGSTNSSGLAYGHIGIYIGDGKIVHASTYATGIKISKWNYRNPVKIVSMF